MSIWSSVGIGDPEIRALDGDDEAAHYRGEGAPIIGIGVATTGFHDKTRLSLNSEDGHVDVCALLPLDDMKTLRARLDAAIGEIERRTP